MRVLRWGVGNPQGKWLIGLAIVVALSTAGCGSPAAAGGDTAVALSQAQPSPCTLADFLNFKASDPRTFVQWGPDGSGVRFTHGVQLYAVAADGSWLQQIVDASGGVYFGRSLYVAGHLGSADVSPDGGRVAYAVCREYQPTEDEQGRWPYSPQIYEIEVWDQVGQATKRLALGKAPAWSPDGARLAFLSSSYDYDPDVHRRPVEKSESSLSIMVADGRWRS